jgi:subtilisin-like proprotein convertase family protein
MRKSLFLCISVALSMAAQAADERCEVSFAGAQQDVCSGKVSAPEAFAGLARTESFKDSDLRLIKFDGPIDAARRAAVEALGAKILDYAPHYAYVVRMPAAQDSRARAIPGVVWSGPFLPAFKIDPNISAELRDGTLSRELGATELSISLYPGADRGALQEAVARAPGLSVVNTVIAGGDTRLTARFERAQLRAAVEQLAADARVSAISLRLPRHLLNSQADWLHQSNVNTPSPLRPLFAQGLYGCGQTVGVLDSGMHIANCAFNDATQTPGISDCNTGSTCPPVAAPNLLHRKVPAYYKWSGDAGGAPADEHGHGTHVNGSIAGNNPANAVDCTNFTTEGGNTDLDGTAPGAKIVMQEMGGNLAYLSNSGNPYHAGDMAYASGARLHSNSWGTGCVNQLGQCISGCTITYDADARDVDNIMRDRPELLVLFAAGNDGSICPAGNNVGSPGNAKSVMTIGATLRGAAGNGMASFSSRGPTADARTKPDLSAQGDSIVSAARNACGTTTMSGTSMATPTAAGLAALVRDYLARGFYPSGARNPADAINNPSGALIKAIMISGTFSMSGSGAGSAPGQSQGWGRVLLDNSLYFNGDTSRLYIHDAPAGLATGGLDVHTVVINAGQPFNATLAWTDAAAAIGASPATVNSLRLEVVAPNGDVWTQKLPAGVSVSNANPTQDTTTANYDNRNTVQRISFTAPAAGSYQLRVRGINVPSGPQRYALAATGALTVGTDPDFALQTTPGASICAGSPANYSIGVQSLNSFTSPVTLSVTGLPGAATGSFTPNPITPAQPPASAQLTVGNTAAVGSGNYNLVIQGNSASPALQHTASATLSVVAATPVAGSLTAPANNATGQATSPAFSWAAIADASSYRIQIATDAGFTALVDNQVVSGTSYTPAIALNPDTTYFWRVYGINACGQGTVSAVFQFHTANEICRSPNLAIPDNTTTGATDNQTVATTGTLNGLRLRIEVTHTYVGDLTLTLSKGATSVFFLQRPGNPADTGSLGCSGNDINVTVDDAATNTLESNCTGGLDPAPAYIAGASYKPNNPLSAFAGQELSGAWSLKAVDSVGDDAGNIVRWCLLPDITPPQPDAIFDDGFDPVTP